MTDLLVLDTGVLIGRSLAVAPTERVTLTALSIAELEFGLSAAAVRGDSMEVRRRSSRLASIRAEFGDGLPFDAAAAITYGIVTRAVLEHGRNPRARAVDLMIAAIAVAAGATLMTTQPHEFAGLQDVLDIRGLTGAS